MEPTEKDILARLRNGDEKVFEKIFRTYYERLCNYANTFLNDIDEAEEMVQSAFLTVWEKHEQIEIHTSMKSYLYRSVYNGCLNRIKHNKVRSEYGSHYKSQANMFSGDASEGVVEDELETLMKDAIELLPQQCRMVFKLSRLENLSYKEIAEQMGISVKTVENHMIKALKTLRENLKEYLPLIIWLLMLRN